MASARALQNEPADGVFLRASRAFSLVGIAVRVAGSLGMRSVTGLATGPFSESAGVDPSYS